MPTFVARFVAHLMLVITALAGLAAEPAHADDGLAHAVAAPSASEDGPVAPHDDCDDETCADHHCHVGHCAFPLTPEAAEGRPPVRPVAQVFPALPLRSASPVHDLLRPPSLRRV